MRRDSGNDRLPVTAAVLAGGRSLRMGADKALLSFEGEPLVARVVQVVSDVCERVVVVTNRPEALADADLPAEVVVLQDEVAFQGPLGGILTALKNAEDDWVLAVAADMPWLSPDVIRALWDGRDGAQVVIPVGERGPEPLLALYHRECAPVAKRVLESGRRRVVAMLPSLEVVEVAVETLRKVDPALRSLVNINTPEELAHAREGEPAAEQPTHEPVHVSVVEAGTRRGRGMPAERAITIHMNNVEIATTQATPENLEELAAGFLVAEGLVTDRDSLVGIDVDHKRGMVYVTTAEELPDDIVHRRRYITAGCGKGTTFASVGHTLGLQAVRDAGTVSPGEICDLMGQMARASELYRREGGVHACALARDGRLLIVREDVGRHNAADKTLGRAWLDRVPTEGTVLLTTGRVSYEMAVKAAKARVPVVASRTAVTQLAAEVATRLGLTLVGYARGGRLNVYTNPDRVQADEGDSR